MKKRSTLIAIVIAVAALATAPLVIAGPHRGARGLGAERGAHAFGMFGHLQRMKEALDLSDQQVDQIKAIFADAHEQNSQYRDQMHGGRKDIAETLLANPNDIAGAQAVMDQQAAAERMVKTNLLNATSKALNVLTADQRAKLRTMLEERAQRWERRER